MHETHLNMPFMVLAINEVCVFSPGVLGSKVQLDHLDIELCSIPETV